METMSRRTALGIRLAAVPVGMPCESDFAMNEGPVGLPGTGELLVRLLYLSVHPGMRSRLRDANRPWEVGGLLSSPGLAEVVESRAAGFTAGTHVVSRSGSRLPWQEFAVVPAADVVPLRPAEVPLTCHLGALGHTGRVAYVGMLDIGNPQPGETVYVSAAAGAVGSIAGQLAKLRGCRVVGSAGTAEKVDVLRKQLGFDAAFNYRSMPPDEALSRLCPEGIDVYFDNVGGDHLQAAFDRMRPHGRIVACGSVSVYNDDGPGPGLDNLRRIVTHRLTMRGYVIHDHDDRIDAHFVDMARWLAEGRIKNLETVWAGLPSTPRAFISMLHGANIGRSLVRV